MHYAGQRVQRVPAGQRVRYMPAPESKRGVRAGQRSHVDAQPPPELRATPAWRSATTHHQRAALIRAWTQRETSPSMWRDAVRRVMSEQEEPNGI